MILSDLEETLARQLGEAESRALAYERALRELIPRFEKCCRATGSTDEFVGLATQKYRDLLARAALDKPMEGK